MTFQCKCCGYIIKTHIIYEAHVCIIGPGWEESLCTGVVAAVVKDCQGLWIANSLPLLGVIAEAAEWIFMSSNIVDNLLPQLLRSLYIDAAVGRCVLYVFYLLCGSSHFMENTKCWASTLRQKIGFCRRCSEYVEGGLTFLLYISSLYFAL